MTTPLTYTMGDSQSSFSHRIEYSLEGHHEKLLGILYCHWLEQSFCDLKLRTSNGILLVHTSVLVAFSPRIAAAVTNLQDRSNQKDRRCKKSAEYCIDVLFDYDVIKSIMETMYSGIFSAETAGLDEMLQALEWLDIEELVDVVKRFRKKISNENSSCSNNSNVLQTATILTKSKSKKGGQKATKSKQRRTEPPMKSTSFSQKGMNMVIASVSDMPFVVPGDYDDRTCVKSEANINATCRDEMNCESLSKIQEDVSQIWQQKDPVIHLASEMDSSNEVIVDSSEKDVSALSQDIGFTPAGREKDGRERKRKKKKKKSESKSRKDGKKSLKKKKSSSHSRKKKKTCTEDVFPLNVTKDWERKKDAAEILVNFGNGEFEPSIVKTEITDDDYAYMELPASEGYDDACDEAAFLSGGKDSVKCQKCKVLFTDIEEYQKHVNDHPIFTCEDCFSVYFTSTNLCRHIRRAHLKSMHLKCSLCEFTAVDVSKYSEHCVNVHQQTQPFKCHFEGCTFKTSKYRYLSRHFANHESFRTYKCDKCEKHFKNYTLLYSHKRSCYHLQNYLCDLCGQSFNHPGSMKIHRRTMHFGEKPHKCKMCVKTFSNNANLRRHMRIHNNSYPYACSVCGQQFRHSNTLKSHMNKHGSVSSEITGDNININKNIPSYPTTNQGSNISVTDGITSEKLASTNLKVLFQTPVSQAQSFNPSSTHQLLNYAISAASDLSTAVSFVPSATTVVNDILPMNSVASIASLQPVPLPIQDPTCQENIHDHIIQRLLWNDQQNSRLQLF